MNQFYTITYIDKPILRDWSTNSKNMHTGTNIPSENVHTGVDLPAENVYSYTDGVVLAVGHVGNHYCVTIQYDVFNLLRYDNLSSVSVGAGEIVQVGAVVGKADRFVHFEYATKEQNGSKWSVRVGNQVYWKQNPNNIQLQQPAPETVIGSATSKETWQGKGW